jgi:hypothetical protein
LYLYNSLLSSSIVLIPKRLEGREPKKSIILTTPEVLLLVSDLDD